MKEFNLKTPLTKDDIKKPSAGDIVYLSGDILTARDKAHKKILEKPTAPFPLQNAIIFHAGPLSKKEKDGKWKIFAIGPTTSSRMNSLTPKIIEKFKISAIIGKGGMNREVAAAMKKHSCIYLAMTGGTAAITAKQIKKIKKVHWESELGAPEAVYELLVNDLGPLIVAIDAKGKSLY